MSWAILAATSARADPDWRVSFETGIGNGTVYREAEPPRWSQRFADGTLLSLSAGRHWTHGLSVFAGVRHLQHENPIVLIPPNELTQPWTASRADSKSTLRARYVPVALGVSYEPSLFPRIPLLPFLHVSGGATIARWSEHLTSVDSPSGHPSEDHFTRVVPGYEIGGGVSCTPTKWGEIRFGYTVLGSARFGDFALGNYSGGTFEGLREGFFTFGLGARF